jgi:hypothetical protein
MLPRHRSSRPGPSLPLPLHALPARPAPSAPLDPEPSMEETLATMRRPVSLRLAGGPQERSVPTAPVALTALRRPPPPLLIRGAPLTRGPEELPPPRSREEVPEEVGEVGDRSVLATERRGGWGGWCRCRRGSAMPPTSSSTPSPSRGRY